MSEFAVRIRRRDQWAVTLVLDHAKTEWTGACNAAHRHLGCPTDEAMHRRGLEVLAARQKP